MNWYSFSSQGSTPDDYTCNKEIHIATTLKKLWIMMRDYFNNEQGFKKFEAAYIITDKEKSIQNDPKAMVIVRAFFIDKRIEENRIFGRAAEATLLYCTGFEPEEIAISLKMNVDDVYRYLNAVKKHLKVDDITEIKPILTKRNNLQLVIVQPMPATIDFNTFH